MNLYYEKPSITKGLRYYEVEGLHKRCFVVKRNLCNELGNLRQNSDSAKR